MLQMFHSTIAYAVLALLLVSTINAFMGISAKRNFTKKDRSLALVALIFSHIQLVVGLALWFNSPVGKAALGQMSNPALRLTAMEHPLINIIALVLITIGWSKHKKEESSNGKFKKIAYLYAIGLVLILSRIPWNLWFPAS
ncbi:hypothetical protein RF683_00330 [Flavobacterium sp. 20NA77.7]|uniref:50S ribosomal protein L27 n=1 Tax=Flavobacterium nakdongensis TaxID=3073563 RepID=A0ABY9R9W2_9FLAO|nr:hypothetical protein [Flavobacterium sp. 20NA77.7]WMW77924.1 hypothetical protein RF683_00330 [Flavobacterium sp. 20NA77.7]